MIHFRIVLMVLGMLLGVESIFLLLSAGIAIYYSGNDIVSLLATSGICISTGLLLFLLNRKATRSVAKKEAYLIVALGWAILSITGSLPFIFHGSIPRFADALFETVSGFTTTGASILDNIESLPKGLLFWRSITQWMGGMGIIVLSIAVMPLIKVGGMQMFIAEVPGVTYDKLHPRVTGTAKRLWLIYIGFTLLETILLWIAGMTLYDAVNHSFTTMATGGYSTKQASIAFYNSPAIEYIIIAFMFIAGTNFTVSYFALKLKFRKVWGNDEFKFYSLIVLVSAAIIAIGLIFYMSYPAEKAIRESLFQVVSIITTTGYVTVDYMRWIPPYLWVILFMLMLIGGSAGSTGGGIKVVRIQLLLRNSYLEMKRMIHPNAVIPVRYNGQSVNTAVISNIMAFVIFYMMIFVISTMIMTFFGLDIVSAMGAVATSLGNIGPGLGTLGPAYTFSFLPDGAKYYLSFLMLLGRLELFTILIIFAPVFWRK